MRLALAGEDVGFAAGVCGAWRNPSASRQLLNVAALVVTLLFVKADLRGALERCSFSLAGLLEDILASVCVLD